MHQSESYPFDVIAEALTSVVGWVIVILLTMLAGFCCGYWIGHKEIVGADKTLKAMAWLPVVWLGQPTVLIAYGVTALSIYLPIRIQSAWLNISAVIVTFIAWAIVVAYVVDATSNGKFWQW